MNKYVNGIVIVMIVTILALLLANATYNQPQPLEDIPVVWFTKIHETSEYTLYEKTFIESNTNYYMYAYSFGIGDDTCIIGDREISHYIVRYKGLHYDLQAVNRMNLFGCDVIEDYILEND